MGQKGMGLVAKRFDVFLIGLDPTIGSEINKTRPCLIISPNEMNDNIATVIVAPMTTKGKIYPSRVNVLFEEKSGLIVLDQIRTIDKTRLIKKLGRIDDLTAKRVLRVLNEMFSK